MQLFQCGGGRKRRKKKRKEICRHIHTRKNVNILSKFPYGINISVTFITIKHALEKKASLLWNVTLTSFNLHLSQEKLVKQYKLNNLVNNSNTVRMCKIVLEDDQTTSLIPLSIPLSIKILVKTCEFHFE